MLMTWHWSLVMAAATRFEASRSETMSRRHRRAAGLTCLNRRDASQDKKENHQDDDPKRMARPVHEPHDLSKFGSLSQRCELIATGLMPN